MKKALVVESGIDEDRALYCRVLLDADQIPSSLVYKLKREDDGSGKSRIQKYKCRLVAGGHRERFNSQIGAQFYEETYSPVVKLDSFRILLALAALYDLELKQLDFKCAYLNGGLPEGKRSLWPYR